MTNHSLVFVEPFGKEYSITIDDINSSLEPFEKDFNEYCFSLRVDVLDDVSKTLLDILDFFKKYDAWNYVIAYEEKSKSQLTAVKPHFHAFFYSEKNHDTMRRHLSSIGYVGSKAMILQSSKKYNIEDTLSYTLKHQQVPLCGFDEEAIGCKQMKILLHLSKQRNENINHNTKKEVFDVVVEALQKIIDDKDIPDEKKYIIGGKMLKDKIISKTIYTIFRKADIIPPVGYKLKELMVNIGNKLYDEELGYTWWVYVNNCAILC